MASLVVRSGALPCLAQKASATRIGRRPAPFTPARRVFVRAAAPEVQAEEEYLDDVTAVDLSELVAELEDDEEFNLEDEDVEILDEADAILDAEDYEEVDVELSAAVEVEFGEAAEADEDEEDKEERSNAAALAEALFLNKLVGAATTDFSGVDLNSLAAVGDDAGEAVEVLDYAKGTPADKYLDVPLTPLEKLEVAPLKLSKGELRNLLPQDWDQMNINFFSNKKEENIPLPEFKLNVLWTTQNVAVAVDQVYSRGQVSPLTEYFFWPRNDAWEEMKSALETRPWISERDKIVLLNRLTLIINFWQDETIKHTVEEARMEFPDCTFMSG